jgi:hypothetical protein
MLYVIVCENEAEREISIDSYPATGEHPIFLRVSAIFCVNSDEKAFIQIV